MSTTGVGGSGTGRDPMRVSLQRTGLKAGVVVVTSLVVACACALVVVHGLAVKQQESILRQRAQLVTEVTLANVLHRSDFEGLPAARGAELLALLRRQVLTNGTAGAALYSRDGRRLLTTDRGLGGAGADAKRDVVRALQGTAVRSANQRGRVDGVSRSVIAEIVPIRSSSGRADGALVLWTDRSTVDAAVWRALLPFVLILPVLFLVWFVALVPLLRRVSRELRRYLDARDSEALHDGLTGLPNRRLFEDRLQRALAQAQREDRATAVVLLDLDQFKEVNDTLGHAAGDSLLREVSARLSATVRGVDTVARLGGDEFALVLTEVDERAVLDTAARIDEALRAPAVIGGLSMTVAGSIGIAVSPGDGDTVSALLQHADVAMYTSKRAGTPFELYDRSNDRHNTERLSLLHELQRAAEKDELVLHYRPTRDLRTGDVVGVSSLLRWNHPVLGLLDAERFMPLAEEIGLATAISERAVADAIRQCGEWRRRGIDLSVAVDLDVRALVGSKLPARLVGLLETHGVDADQIELEINETSITSDPLLVRRVALELDRIGVKLAIGAFGSGHSSLNYLSQLPVSTLKIDRSFIGQMRESPRQRIIVVAMIELAHSLGLEVLADGVDDEETAELILKVGGDLVQGSHVGVPADAASFMGPAAAWAAA